MLKEIIKEDGGKMKKKIFIINPGSTSTVCAYFEDEEEIKRDRIEYTPEQLSLYHNAIEQFEFRMGTIRELINKWGIKEIDAVVGRCGTLKPIESGAYKVNDNMINDIKDGRVQIEHISNIGPLLARTIADELNVPAFTVDGVSVDEMEPLARVSGIPDIKRVSLQHTLNVRAMGIKAARELGKSFNEVNFVVAHLGGGITISAIKEGKIIDVNNAAEEGPFSPERSGGLPVSGLIKLCFSGTYNKKGLLKRVVGKGGLIAYLGTNKLKEVEERINNGDEKARFYLEAMAYQIAKEIGGMTTVLKGKMDAILLIGSGAKCKILVDTIKERVSFLANIIIFPGENEMLALTQGALRVLKGEEQAKEYT